MIDIHSHVLPGLDDGAAGMEEALAMARMAAAAGTTDLVATPHASETFAFDPRRVELALEELREAAGDAPRIHYGCEMHLTPEGIERVLRAPHTYTIAHRGYLLVEFSDLLVPATSAQIFAGMLAAGVRPIIVHPERNPILRARVAELERWVAQGCLLQVTAQSLLGRFGKAAEAASREWIERDLVHFVASDGHDPKHRPAVLDQGWRSVEKAFGSGTARRLMVENPRAVLDGTPVAAAPLRAPKRRWFALR